MARFIDNEEYLQAIRFEAAVQQQVCLLWVTPNFRCERAIHRFYCRLRNRCKRMVAEAQSLGVLLEEFDVDGRHGVPYREIARLEALRAAVRGREHQINGWSDHVAVYSDGFYVTDTDSEDGF